MGAGTIGDVSQDFRPVLELNPVDTVGKRLHHDPLHEWEALGHETRLYQTPGDFCLGPHASAGEGIAVSTSGPLSVIATVCSK